MLEEFHVYIVVKISNVFTNCRDYIPFENKIINIINLDEIACNEIGKKVYIIFAMKIN